MPDTAIAALITKAAPVAADKLVGTDSVDGGSKNFTLTGIRSHLFTLSQPADTTALRFLTIQPAAAGTSQFVFETNNTTFATVADPILSVGYNMLANGAVLQAAEPQFGWKIEANYQFLGSRTMEQYWQYADGVGGAFRPLFANIRPSTNECIFSITADSLTIFKPLPLDSPNAIPTVTIVPARLQVNAQAGGNSALMVSAGATRAGQLLLGFNNVDSVVQMTPGPTANTLQMQVNSQITYFTALVGGLAAPGFGIGVAVPVGHLHIKPTNTNLTGIIVDQIAGGAGALLLMRDSAGTTTYSRFNKDGYFMTRKTAAPADADIATGEMALWFDSTNGAAKLKIKAKQADGTVRVGEVALA